MASHLNNAELVAGYLNAFATGNPDEIVKHVADDFENIQVSELGTGCIGIDTYRERLSVFLAAFEKLRYTINELIVDEDKVAAAYTMRFKSEGRNIEIEGVMILTVRDSLILIRKDYWDGLSYQKQADG